MEMRPMTNSEILEVVRAKERNLDYIRDQYGIFSYPFSSERDSLKRWREILAGRIPPPLVPVK